MERVLKGFLAALVAVVGVYHQWTSLDYLKEALSCLGKEELVAQAVVVEEAILPQAVVVAGEEQEFHLSYAVVEEVVAAVEVPE